MNDMNFGREGAISSPNGADAAHAEALKTPKTNVTLLTHYLAIARRRKWVVLGALVTALAIGLITTLMMTRQYTATSTIEIQRENYNIVRVQGVEPETSSIDMEFYQTQYGLLRSQSLAERVATDLRLYDQPSFFQMFGHSGAGNWFDGTRVRPGASTREQRIHAAGGILLRGVGIAPVRLSRLVDVNFTSPDPDFSARVVDAWGRHFIEATLERRINATSYARRFLEQRLAQLRTRLDESERVLVGYASRENIINLPGPTPVTGETGSTGAGERSIVAEDLSAINRELARATADRVAAESRLRTPSGSVPEALNNQAITGLRQRRAELAAEHSRLMVQFEPQYPPAVAVRQQMQQLDLAIAREETRVGSTLRGTYDSSVAREQDLAGRVESLKGNLIDLRRRSIQYNMYQRDVDTNRQLYDALLQRYKEIGVAGGVGVNNISVVDPPLVPNRPSSPRLLINLLLALLAGTAVGLGLALALEQIDDAISDPSEVNDLFSLPSLGAIPNLKDDPLAGLQDRKSDISEAYLAVQANLAFSTDHGMPRTLAVTSTGPGEGKSITAYALALSLARTGRKTLLIDADMRSPSVHHLAGVTNEKGLSNFLSGDNEVDALVRKTSEPGVFLLTAGPQPPSAAELLASSRLEVLVKQLSASFDVIVVDAPPVMGLADGPRIASQVEGVVFVVRANATRARSARFAIGRLASSQARILGVVLSRFEARRAYYGSGYAYGYGYGQTAEA